MVLQLRRVLANRISTTTNDAILDSSVPKGSWVQIRVNEIKIRTAANLGDHDDGSV